MFNFFKKLPTHLIFGQKAEKFAAKELKKQGYKIIERNWKKNKHELDIIAKKDEVLYFFEVRARQANALISPEQSFTQKKKDLVYKAAKYYMLLNNYTDAYTFSFIAVEAQNKEYSIKIYEHVITK